MSNTTKTTLEKTNGFDVLHVEGSYNWDQARALPAQVQGQHGIDDWVLPDRMTLKALTGISEGIEGWHWSASPYVGSSNYAWGVYFGYGLVYYLNRGYSYQVRLVRASQCLGICAEAAKKSMAEVGIDAAIAPITSAPSPWVNLDIETIVDGIDRYRHHGNGYWLEGFWSGALWAETKLREKNTGESND